MKLRRRQRRDERGSHADRDRRDERDQRWVEDSYATKKACHPERYSALDLAYHDEPDPSRSTALDDIFDFPRAACGDSSSNPPAPGAINLCRSCTRIRIM